MAQNINQPTIHTADIVRPTQVEVYLEYLKENFLAIKKHVAPARVMPVLKANAYGHGIVRVAQLMQQLQADYLGVAVLEEGILLRESGITMPILVLGGILGNQVPHFLTYDLTITASSIDKLKQVDRVAKEMGRKAKVHLKIDTGMERIGVHYYNAEGFIKASLECTHLVVEGIFSHLANSDTSDSNHTHLQVSRFQEVLACYGKLGIPLPFYQHIANSGGILQLAEARFNLVRPGIMLYGVYPSREVKRTVKVKPALSWKSRVVYFKVIQPGHPVGYGSTWQTDHPVRAVTVPVGYGDGYFRSMSHKAQVIISGKRYPVIGRISMDQIVVNIESDSAYNDDEVALIGAYDGEHITVEDLAAWAGTSPYEILTNINTRVPRVYVE
jgi:alanine racemase